VADSVSVSLSCSLNSDTAFKASSSSPSIFPPVDSGIPPEVFALEGTGTWLPRHHLLEHGDLRRCGAVFQRGHGVWCRFKFSRVSSTVSSILQ
jgi:hypothetical protein